MPAHPAIRLERVSKRYGDAAPTLADLSLDVPARTFLAVVGASGSGKTTLLRLVNRLSDPSEGAVEIDGENVRNVAPHVLRRRIGYVFQEVGLFPHMTIAENIAVTPRLLGWSRPDITARVAELLDLVRLPADYAERYPKALSGGERQRVGVARALAARPAIMLMDEPFAALDPLTREALGADYRALHDELALTTVMITHDMLEALFLAHRIAVLDGGRIVADEPPGALLAHEHPYVRRLLEAPRNHAARLETLLGGERAS
ncbi:MAG: ATP-binding cassette domain-containing protein [Hyphomicrobiaceae bacterium]